MSMHTHITRMIATMTIFRPKTFDKAAWSKTYNKERREYYKAHFICAQCGAAMARTGFVDCEDCARKASERRKRTREQTAAHEKDVRERRYAKGLCKDCGKRKARPDRVTCQKCADKRAERDRNRVVKRHMAQYKADFERGIIHGL